MYALICDDSKYVDLPTQVGKDQLATKMICGVYSEKAEAEEASKHIEDCLCVHHIKRCKVTVEF